MAKHFSAIKETPTGPVRTFEETDILKSSNTWEFLIFEQIRAIRFIQHSIFSEPRTAKFHILNLVVSLSHLESMLYYRINPSRDKTSNDWKEYIARKPEMFKDLTKDITGIKNMANSDEFTQLQLVMIAEEWFTLLDKYLSGIKRIDAVSFEMKLPDHYDSVFEADINESPNPGISPITDEDVGDNSGGLEVV